MRTIGCYEPMQKRHERVSRIVGVSLLACLTTFALGLDMSVDLPAKLTATLREGDFFGQINNLLVVLNHFHTMDHLTGLLALIACFYLYDKYLALARGRLGEYLLSGFFALAMLVSEAAATEETVACLWAGSTQCLKAVLYLMGMQPLFLAGIRLLDDGLKKMSGLTPLRKGTAWDRHPFALPLAVMAICWVPFLAMKYPGGMSPDVTVQIQEYLGNAITASHPPFSTIVYGTLYQLGVRLGNPNWGIFFITLLQTICYLCVLAYACLKMRRWGVPALAYGAVLSLFCLSVNYSGWTTCLVKDVPYVIACILLCVLLIDMSVTGEAFFHSRSSMALVFVAFVNCWLWRRNGPAMALGCALAMLLFSRPGKGGNRPGRRRGLFLSLAAALVFCVGINAALNEAWTIGPAAKREVYSHLLQMTGRVVKEHGEAMTDEEIAVIDKVLEYDSLAEGYDPIITDGVKALFHENATQEEYGAYRRLVLEQFRRYPFDYLDAYLNLTYRLFDIRSDRGDYIQRREISHPYYIRSYTNQLYRQEELRGLDAAQEAVEAYHYWFADLPLVGLFSNVGLCTDVMLAIGYLFYRKKKRGLASILPAALTAIFCLGSPLVYIRYALPITATLPLWLAAWVALPGGGTEE